MHAKTLLDQLLYKWLAQADDRLFDLAFKRYYSEASAQLMRYLARRSSLPDLDCEQIAVDALLKFFSRVGRDRRQASASVGSALSRIEPLNLGAFHIRQVRRWTEDVASFRQASVNFTCEVVTGSLNAEIAALADRIAPLRRQGAHLLDTARALATGNDPEGSQGRCAPEKANAGEDDACADEAKASDDEAEVSPNYGLLREFALSLRDVTRTSAGYGEIESQHPGFKHYVDGTWTVVEGLPLLRVPTNGYLFDIAQSLYLDECKARGRRKRGGMGKPSAGTEAPGSTGAPTAAISLAMDDSDWPDEDAGNRGAVSFGSAIDELGVDPTGEQIDEDFCERFYAYLRKPLQDAEEAYRQAAARGRAVAERKRLESMAKKNDRLMTVLVMRIEGRTQEEIAANLDLSRNQVKYIVELVQSAYQQFCTATPATSAPSDRQLQMGPSG
jgi:DNA-directed RNA polymerase specialized sigma24 family protein